MKIAKFLVHMDSLREAIHLPDTTKIFSVTPLIVRDVVCGIELFVTDDDFPDRDDVMDITPIVIRHHQEETYEWDWNYPKEKEISP